jgi:hypothetical protein
LFTTPLFLSSFFSTPKNNEVETKNHDFLPLPRASAPASARPPCLSLSASQSILSVRSPRSISRPSSRTRATPLSHFHPCPPPPALHRNPTTPPLPAPLPPPSSPMHRPRPRRALEGSGCVGAEYGPDTN